MEFLIEKALEQGQEAFNQGKLQMAEELYRGVLYSNPKHPDANHSLGLIAVSLNKSEMALPFFETALEVNPSIEQFWFSYINALIKEKQYEKAYKICNQSKNNVLVSKRIDALSEQLMSTTNQKSSSKLELSTLVKYYQNGRYEEAEKLALSITQQFPSNQFSWKVLAAILLQTGRLSDALIANQKSVLLAPKDAEAYYNLGVNFQGLGKLEDAESSYRKAIEINFSYAEAYYNLGVTLQGLRKLKEAESSYKQAIIIKPNYAEAYYNMGNIQKDVYRLEDAIESYRKAIAQNSNYAEAYSNLGITLYQLGRLEEAIINYKQAIVLRPNFTEVHTNLGVALQDLNRLEEAEISYRKAITLNPEYSVIHNNLGNILQKFGRLEEAEVSYRKAITLDPHYATAHFNLGITLLHFSRLKEAEDSFNQAIALKTDYAEAYSNLGLVLYGMSKLEDAEVSYRKAIELKPGYAEAYHNLGNTLNKIGKLEEAETSYRKAIALNPNNAETYYSLAIFLQELSRCKEAEKYCRISIALEPGDAKNHFLLGVILYSNIGIDAALESAEKAYRLDATLKGINLFLIVLKSRKAFNQKDKNFGYIENRSATVKLVSNPLILNRSVEKELINKLYNMSSIKLEKIKDARYGNGICSPDFNLFEDKSPIIKAVADDLTNIMMDVVKSNIFVQDAFFNILAAGGGSTPHQHLTNIDKIKELGLVKQKFSLVYYLSVGDQNCSVPGILKLYEPCENILPSEGMIIIIPADRKHSAVYGGKKDRIMIGVNFYSIY